MFDLCWGFTSVHFTGCLKRSTQDKCTLFTLTQASTHWETSVLRPEALSAHFWCRTPKTNREKVGHGLCVPAPHMCSICVSHYMFCKDEHAELMTWGDTHSQSSWGPGSTDPLVSVVPGHTHFYCITNPCEEAELFPQIFLTCQGGLLLANQIWINFPGIFLPLNVFSISRTFALRQLGENNRWRQRLPEGEEFLQKEVWRNGSSFISSCAGPASAALGESYRFPWLRLHASPLVWVQSAGRCQGPPQGMPFCPSLTWEAIQEAPRRQCFTVCMKRLPTGLMASPLCSLLLFTSFDTFHTSSMAQNLPGYIVHYAEDTLRMPKRKLSAPVSKCTSYPLCRVSTRENFVVRDLP